MAEPEQSRWGGAVVGLGALLVVVGVVVLADTVSTLR